MQKQLLNFFLLLLFTGCSHSDSWNVSRLHTNNAGFDAAKLFYRSPDKIEGVDVELLVSQNILHIYLNMHADPVPPYKNDIHRALVYIQAEEKTLHAIAFRHEGGNRVLLPEAIYPELLALLQEEPEIVISLEGYRGVIDTTSFGKKFIELQKAPFPTIPVGFSW